jgi:hypothetical protein
MPGSFFPAVADVGGRLVLREALNGLFDLIETTLDLAQLLFEKSDLNLNRKSLRLEGRFRRLVWRATVDGNEGGPVTHDQMSTEGSDSRSQIRSTVSRCSQGGTAKKHTRHRSRREQDSLSGDGEICHLMHARDRDRTRNDGDVL